MSAGIEDLGEDREYFIVKAKFLQHDGDFEAIGCAFGVECNVRLEPHVQVI